MAYTIKSVTHTLGDPSKISLDDLLHPSHLIFQLYNEEILRIQHDGKIFHRGKEIVFADNPETVEMIKDLHKNFCGGVR